MEVVDGKSEVGEDLFQGNATAFFKRTNTNLDRCSFVRRNWLIVEGRFIPGWQSSHGATWERQSLPKHGSVVNDLSLEDIRRFMERVHSREHVDMVMGLLSA